MGAYYARQDGEGEAVANALGEFYQPRFAGDEIPASGAGRCVALADKLDTLTGIFGVGGAPTGDKDPYARRRAALGCLRICIESDSAIDLAQALEQAASGHGERITPATAAAVFDFVLERARGYFVDRGSRADVVESVLVTRPGAPRELARRIAAVDAFLQLPEAVALAAANKRIGNILRKATGFTPGATDNAQLVEEAELALARELEDASLQTAGFAEAGDYQAYLACLARLQAPVNVFFDQVMVMAEDPVLRNARLQLLYALQALFLRVADISLIAS
jgi:glycyl-tRNA synthetase beta chain